MSQSLTKLYAHIIFSTKYRLPLLCDINLRSELHSYIGCVLKTLNSNPLKINSVTDHIHILCSFSKRHSISKIIGEIKRVSSIWIKTKDVKLNNFYWQDGYGAFTVGRSEINRTIKYIDKQQSHHSKKTFRNEFLEFLQKYDAEYDERYIWD